MNPKIISFCGNDGSGKSSGLSAVSDWMEQAGIQHCLLRDPGGPRISEKIRQLLLDPENTEMSLNTELLLYCAARAQLVDQAIKPSIEKGSHVLLDRFHHSTWVYQGIVNGADRGVIKALDKLTTHEYKYAPEITVFLVVEPKVGLKRRDENFDLDRQELKGLEFQQKVRDGYQAIYKELAANMTPPLTVHLLDTTEMNQREMEEACVTIVKGHVFKEEVFNDKS